MTLVLSIWALVSSWLVVRFRAALRAHGCSSAAERRQRSASSSRDCMNAINPTMICFLVRLGLPDACASSTLTVTSDAPVVVGCMPDTYLLESEHCAVSIEGRHAELAATAEGLRVTALAGDTYVDGSRLQTGNAVAVMPPAIVSFGGQHTMQVRGVVVPNSFVYMFVRRNVVTPFLAHTQQYAESMYSMQGRIVGVVADALADEAYRAARRPTPQVHPIVELPNSADLAAFLKDSSTCIICTEESVQPHQLACGHLGCGACVMRWWDMKGECPVCRVAVPRPVLNRVLDGALRALHTN